MSPTHSAFHMLHKHGEFRPFHEIWVSQLSLWASPALPGTQVPTPQHGCNKGLGVEET